MPRIALTAAMDNDSAEVDPRFSDQLRLFVIVKNRYFQLQIIRRLVYGVAEFLVPS